MLKAEAVVVNRLGLHARRVVGVDGARQTFRDLGLLPD